MACPNPHSTVADARCEIRKLNHQVCTGWSEAVGQYLDWTNPDYTPPTPTLSKKDAKDRLKVMAAKVPAREPVSGFAAGVEGSERAAQGWTDEEKTLVDRAIAAVARRHVGGNEFTADAIWDELAGAVPVTKGLTSRLLMAQRRGLIGNTGKVEISERGGHHDHGQRLTLWYSLVPKT